MALQRDPVADLESSDVGTDVDDGAGALVPRITGRFRLKACAEGVHS
jgi:hypothetical protein